MQRWTALLFLGLVALAVVLVVTAKPEDGGRMSASAESAAASGSSAGPGGDPIILAPTTMPVPVLPFDIDAGAPLPDLAEASGENADAGATLPDGTPVPALESSAPQKVIFGVILVHYRGAQGAPRDARTREAAQELAEKLAKEAKEDFAAAARQADVGLDNAGEMRRGVLEPGPEYTLFNLAVGDVGGPVDSPRGFYVFKRIE
jgi:hypothetical protein